MKPGQKYWSFLDPIWGTVDIDSTEEFTRTFGLLPRNVGLLYAAHFCQSEICNGGFTQLFWNSTGILSPEAIEAFVVIRQPKVAAVLDAAVKMLATPFPRDRADRKRELEALQEEPIKENEYSCASYRNVSLFSPLEDEFFLKMSFSFC
jgi:hypothetical protein